MTGLGLTAWIYLLDKKIKEQVDSNILQGTERKFLVEGYICVTVTMKVWPLV